MLKVLPGLWGVSRSTLGLGELTPGLASSSHSVLQVGEVHSASL